jgi:hypothetical protein
MRKAIYVFVVLTLGYYAWQWSNHAGSDVSSDAIEQVQAKAQSCTAADFSLSKTKAAVEYDEAKLTGIVTSHCASAAGVRLKWTAFNPDGTVAFSSDFWPASTTNIPPHTDYAFEMMNSAPRGKWTYRVVPISVDVW